MLRILLFLATNLAVIVVAGIVLQLLGIDGYLTGTGLNLGSLLIFAAVLGFGGSFVSLFLSKWMAKMGTRAKVITSPSNDVEAWLLSTVRQQAQRAGIGMPDVAIFDSPDVNAFATGWNRNDALVAVSTGLLRSMDRPAAEAVLGHEVSHVANGDMVTLSLVQGVTNTFVIFLSRVVGFLVDSWLSRGEERRGPGIGYWVGWIAAEIVFGVLASMIVAWFSRRREFRADAGGAALSSRESMISALEVLQRIHQPAQLPESVKAFGIRDGGSFMKLFSTHPPLETRIARLRAERALESRAGVQFRR